MGFLSLLAAFLLVSVGEGVLSSGTHDGGRARSFRRYVSRFHQGHWCVKTDGFCGRHSISVLVLYYDVHYYYVMHVQLVK